MNMAKQEDSNVEKHNYICTACETLIEAEEDPSICPNCEASEYDIHSLESIREKLDELVKIVEALEIAIPKLREERPD